MLKADVQQDYKNDWIKRCLNLKNADYSLLSQKDYVGFLIILTPLMSCDRYLIASLINAKASQ